MSAEADARRLPVAHAASPAAARLLAMLAEARERTLRAVDGLSTAELDHCTAELPVSIGSHLVHLAAIEVDWLWTDLRAEAIPAGELAGFPFDDVRDGEGRLSAVRGWSLAQHVALLARCRAALVEHAAGLSEGAMTVPVAGLEGSSTPEWILHHLLQHEAEHRGQIRRLKALQRASG